VYNSERCVYTAQYKRKSQGRGTWSLDPLIEQLVFWASEELRMQEFAITFKPDMTPERIVHLTKQAENNGFGYGWIFDSHVLWQEPYPLLTLMAINTDAMRFGTCVTNPAAREWTVTASLLATLNRISGGRMDLGIGRGDSSRRVMGKRPTTLADLEACVQTVRDLCAGERIVYEGQEIQMTWADGGIPPVWVAGYGPKA